jgi:hypothetical protein
MWYDDGLDMNGEVPGAVGAEGTVGADSSQPGIVSTATLAYFDALANGTIPSDVTQERDDAEPESVDPLGPAQLGPYYVLFTGYAGTVGPFNYWHYVVVDSSKSIVTNVKVREVLTELYSWGLPSNVQGGDSDGFLPLGGEIYDQMGTAAPDADGVSVGFQVWQVEEGGTWVDASPTMLQTIIYQNGQLVEAEPTPLNNPTPFTNPVPYSPQGSCPPGHCPP